MKGHRFLDHTADIKIEAWGNSIEEAFEAAGVALYDVILDVENIEEKIEKRIEANGFDMMSLLYNWIDSLILIFELDNLVFRDFKVEIERNGEDYRLRAVANGEEYKREKHGYKVHVKAMTYHEMEIIEEGERVFIRYVVDI